MARNKLLDYGGAFNIYIRVHPGTRQAYHKYFHDVLYIIEFENIYVGAYIQHIMNISLKCMTL